MVTLSAVQSLNPALRALATVEWTNWSRLQSVPVLGVPGSGGNPAMLDAQWHDGWFVSGGT